jgi:hypothetical protein
MARGYHFGEEHGSLRSIWETSLCLIGERTPVKKIAYPSWEKFTLNFTEDILTVAQMKQNYM